MKYKVLLLILVVGILAVWAYDRYDVKIVRERMVSHSGAISLLRAGVLATDKQAFINHSVGNIQNTLVSNNFRPGRAQASGDCQDMRNTARSTLEEVSNTSMYAELFNDQALSDQTEALAESLVNQFLAMAFAQCMMT